MPSGPWHYTEGERIAQLAQQEDTPEWMAARAQLATAHFTAAAAAATALLGPVAAQDPTSDPDYNAWIEAACETTQAEAQEGDVA